MDKALLTLILVLCSAFSVSKDLTWQPNSNWEQSDNWRLGRQPCQGDTVRFEKPSRPTIIRLSSDVTVRGLVLPRSGSFKLALGSGSRIRLSNATQCDSAATVVAKAGDNVFVGARDRLWECPENWRTVDKETPKSAPCGDDTAVFPEDSSFSFVTSNSSKPLNVAAVRVRGEMVTDFKNLSTEFPSLNVVIRPECLSNGIQCECPAVPKTCTTQPPTVAPPNTGGLGGGNPGGVAAGVVIVVIVVIVIVVLVIVAIVWWMKSGRSSSFHPYQKETLDEPAVSFSKDEEAAVNFDNPMFDTTSDFDELVGAEELPEPTVAVGTKGGGDGYDHLPEKKPL